MSVSRLAALLALVAAILVHPAAAQDLSALARVRDGAFIGNRAGGIELKIPLTVAVPYRVFTLDNPRRLVLDFNEVDWSGVSVPGLVHTARVGDVRFGKLAQGWSRLVVGLKAPMVLDTATVDTDASGGGTVLVTMLPASAEAFAKAAGAPAGALAAPLRPVEAEPREAAVGLLTVVLDPGHGGIDPGAERDGQSEAALVLAFARELKEELLRTGQFRVVMTRDENVFVPLERRVSIAREAGADVFISLHADALAQGRASGATVYTLSETASDVASEKLAERHDRGDLLAGVDLSGQDDVIAGVLMQIARTETAPRSDALADALVKGLAEAVGVHKRPKLSAAFSVLKAPDIPSVLVELGFLSSKVDRANLSDPGWRHRAAVGMRKALQAWAAADAEEATLRRR